MKGMWPFYLFNMFCGNYEVKEIVMTLLKTPTTPQNKNVFTLILSPINHQISN